MKACVSTTVMGNAIMACAYPIGVALSTRRLARTSATLRSATAPSRAGRSRLGGQCS